MTSDKKTEKLRSKSEKKALKAGLKAQKKSASDYQSTDGNSSAAEESDRPLSDGPSMAVRYAEFVRGCIYVLTGVSIVVAIILGQRGAIISLDDVIDSLFAAIAGKLVLVLIGIALLIYGCKHLRIIK